MRDRILIPAHLFELMSDYIYDHYDPEDLARFREIDAAIQKKRDAQHRHALYSAYKMLKEPRPKETIRRLYLEAVGIPESFIAQHWEGDGHE